jgi:ubiquinone/menaquinone biosynthesis C-methylase UbiE
VTVTAAADRVTRTAAAPLRAVQSWLSESQLGEIYTAAYWNDIEEEKKKEWWVEDGNYDECRRYLERCGLLLEYSQAEPFIHGSATASLRVVDLAAGIGWTSALISRLENVAEVHAVEISKHRLERLFPHAVTMFAGDADKIHRYLGSFYDLQFPPQTMDVVYLSHAFHHADRPLQLLVECDRVLKPGGRIIVAGEHQIGLGVIARRFLSVLLRQRRLVTDFSQLFPPDPVLGDHYYRHSDYRLLFTALGYRVQHRVADSGNGLYVADKLAAWAANRVHA